MDLVKSVNDNWKFLKSIREIFFEYIISVAVSMFFILLIYIWLFPTITPLTTDSLKDFKLIEISFAVSLFTGIVVGIFTGKLIVNYTYQRTKILGFLESHEKLKKEIRSNIIKLRNFRKELDKIDVLWMQFDNKTPHWLPKSINPLRNTMQYASTKEYDYFISLDNPDMDSGSQEQLFNFYFFCGTFSALSQSIEAKINNYRIQDEKRDEESYKLFISSETRELRKIYWSYYKGINEAYNNLNPKEIIPLGFEKDHYLEWRKN